MKPAYYNEFDPYAAEWLRNLIRKGLIPDGDVDDRSIVDIQPDDLRGYGQRHLFAGIGGWAYACRLAGYQDDADIITGSPPCQPFSVAGRQRGIEDDRHLWPEMARLIASLRPAAVAIENVANIVGVALDGMLADLESSGFACRAFVVPACAVDAPHRRDRVWIAARAVGNAASTGRYSTGVPGKEVFESREIERPSGRSDDGDRPLVDAPGVGRTEGRTEHELRRGRPAASGTGSAGPVADANDSERRADDPSWNVIDGQEARRHQGDGHAVQRRRAEPVADTLRPAGQQDALGSSGDEETHGRAGRHQRQPHGHHGSPVHGKGGFWDGAGWISGADGKARRIPKSGIRELDPGLSPGMAGVRPIPLLARNVPQRIQKLKGLGNAICPQVAEQILRSLAGKS